jgi:hypothetical protein
LVATPGLAKDLIGFVDGFRDHQHGVEVYVPKRIGTDLTPGTTGLNEQQ